MALKKAQLTISQAFMMARANGENLSSYDHNGDGHVAPNDAVYFLQGKALGTFKKYFKTQDIELQPYVANKCKNATGPCIDTTLYDIDGSIYNKKFYSSDKSPTYSFMFLADGTYIQLYSFALEYEAQWDLAKKYQYYAIVDVNGPFKKPNKAGYDVFGFYITASGNVTPMGLDFKKGEVYYDEDEEDYADSSNGDCLSRGPKGLCATSSAISGKNPDGTEYWKGIKYWQYFSQK